MSGEDGINNGEYWFNRGENERDCGNLRQAQLCFERAVELDAEVPKYWAELGLTFSECGEHEIAIKCLRRATDLDPKC
ncbi:MAG TPA: tetratricopeptide repeat protein, partial [Methanocorpusculum sp.]|nr:tetratricopeptide repeat protein [Methanocorpusculum sp.]